MPAHQRGESGLIPLKDKPLKQVPVRLERLVLLDETKNLPE
jgi:hypothetical protein